jgi:hypothetical protein
MQVKEYTIVMGSAGSGAIKLFEKEVNAMIAQGWQPLGGIACDSDDGSVYQVMVR